MITAVIILIGVIAIAAYLTRTLDKKDELPTVPTYTKEELDNIKLVEELYNKDLRTTVAKKAPKKEKVVEQVETIAEVITPEVIEKVVEIAKVTPETTTVNIEAAVEVTKPEFPIDKPKKKRKYYPRKPKTNN